MPHRSWSPRPLCRSPIDPRRGDRPRPSRALGAVPRPSADPLGHSLDRHRLGAADRRCPRPRRAHDRGQGAAPWLVETGLPLTSGGFIAIDETLRSTGDQRIFAAGDVATMTAHPREKAGVYAVRQGPPLAANLRRALAGRRLRRAVPQRRGLALIGTGDEHAVASRGPFAAYGPRLWRLKDWIDRRWMRRYRELPEMLPEPGEDPMRCGGCAAKVPAAALDRVMELLQPETSSAILSGLDSPDDA